MDLKTKNKILKMITSKAKKNLAKANEKNSRRDENTVAESLIDSLSNL